MVCNLGLCSDGRLGSAILDCCLLESGSGPFGVWKGCKTECGRGGDGNGGVKGMG